METLATRPLTAHPDDHYLSVVLRKREDGYEPYVTHIHNSTLAEGQGGYVEGHYFEKYEDALEDFKTRR